MNNLPLKLNTPLFFCGLKHCGKTTHGKLAAKQFRLQFCDGDDLILEKIQEERETAECTVREYYRRFGPEAFLKTEAAALKQALIRDRLSGNEVLYSLGGGICDNNAALSAIKRAGGTIIYIQQEEQVLFARIKKKGLPPFLETDDPVKSFHRLFTDRDAKYRELADIIIDISGERPIAESYTLIADELKTIGKERK